jgi:hypothetical protein
MVILEELPWELLVACSAAELTTIALTSELIGQGLSATSGELLTCETGLNVGRFTVTVSLVAWSMPSVLAELLRNACLGELGVWAVDARAEPTKTVPVITIASGIANSFWQLIAFAPICVFCEPVFIGYPIKFRTYISLLLKLEIGNINKIKKE